MGKFWFGLDFLWPHHEDACRANHKGQANFITEDMWKDPYMNFYKAVCMLEWSLVLYLAYCLVTALDTLTEKTGETMAVKKGPVKSKWRFRIYHVDKNRIVVTSTTFTTRLISKTTLKKLVKQELAKDEESFAEMNV